MILYRCLLSCRSAAERLLSNLETLTKDGVLPDTAALHSSSGSTLGLRRESTHILVYLHGLSPSEQIALQTVGVVGCTHCLALSPDEETFDAVGLCWDVLTAINVFYPTDVWICDRLYSAERIGIVASLRIAEFGDRTSGYILTPAEFRRLLESRG